ncbi:lytic transglycosylase domain-containing protein [Methylobacterium nigriterrae]|uniref:lytic transglycosylase domain-containing protein n=1 Tax=Methylobacterium nigriterrae TaxID=3127512 RepID=UPI003013D184
MLFRLTLVTCALGALSLPAVASGASDGTLDALIAKHAQANGVPEALVHRVVQRESRYNARAQHRGNYGLMQIKHGTARTMGYSGSASGLLDANTNLSYAVPYLAAAYRAAGGDQRRAVSLYTRGFYDVTKRQGIAVRTGSTVPPAAPSHSQPEQKVAQATMPWF